MPWYKLEINFHIPDDEKRPDITAADIEGYCYQLVKDYADDFGMDMVFEIDEEDKNI